MENHQADGQTARQADGQTAKQTDGQSEKQSDSQPDESTEHRTDGRDSRTYFFPVLAPDELRTVSALGLAHMGDGVFELLVRSWLCVHGKATGRDLHRSCVALVRAESQAARAEKILPLLTGEERAVYKRGRNAQPHTVPHHATRAQYAAATALEALLGWLYLRGQRERIEELFSVMMEGDT